jgi:hypothetical protein
MTSMMLCDENTRNMINPYTATGTYGVSWNGGYHPDNSLEYIRPFDNKVIPEPQDDFVPPMYITPSNIYLKTQEARRDDIMTGGIPTRIYEDRTCEYTNLSSGSKGNVNKGELLDDDEKPVKNLLLFGLIVAILIFVLTLKN